MSLCGDCSHIQPCSGASRYADAGVRGGVLEAEGMVEIKFRKPDLLATMHRIDPVIAKLKARLFCGSDGKPCYTLCSMRLPAYGRVACAFPSCDDASYAPEAHARFLRSRHPSAG